jgi:predicted RNA-binding Zn-ribbon protein involved in translation (DUF1610 family)
MQIDPDARPAYFGELWPSGLTDEADPIPTPVGQKCMNCGEEIMEGDQGVRFINGPYQHRECGLRNVMGGIGHHVNHAKYCHGPLGTDAGLSYRDSALLVWDWYVNGERVTEQELDILRQVKHE